MGQYTVFVVHLGGMYAPLVGASLGVQYRNPVRQELIEILIGRHDQVFTRGVGGDEGGDDVIGFPLVVLDPVDAQQIESFVDAGRSAKTSSSPATGGLVVALDGSTRHLNRPLTTLSRLTLANPSN